MDIDKTNIVAYTIRIDEITLTGIRCSSCGSLLFKTMGNIINGNLTIECKCSRCNQINLFTIQSVDP